MKNNMFIILGGMQILLLYFFEWSIIEWVTPFMMPFICFISWIVFLVVLIISIIKTKRNWKRNKQNGHKNGVLAYGQITFLILTLIVIMIFPFTSFDVDMDFYANQSEREKVIELLTKGSIKPAPNESFAYPLSVTYPLPDEFKHLSSGGGDVMVVKFNGAKQVMFYTYRVILDNWSGFIYSSDGTVPDGDRFNADFKEVKKYSTHWYWVSAT